MSLLLIFNIFHTFFSASFVDFEKVNVCWGIIRKLCNNIINQKIAHMQIHENIIVILADLVTGA